MSGLAFARNVGLNLLGQVAPLLAALACIPPLIHGVGTERFGILVLAWAGIGYFSLFDFGLSRALTQAVSSRLGTGSDSPAELTAVSWTAIATLGVLGTIGGVVIAAVTTPLVNGVLRVPAELQRETVIAFWILAASLPFTLTTGALRGLFEAHQHFGAANALRLPLVFFTYVSPLLVLPFSTSLVPLVGALAFGRVLTFALHFAVALRRYGYLRTRPQIARRALTPLLQLGGWMTVSNVVSPLMAYLDRFLIGALLPMTAVALYVTPFEVATRLWIIPAGVLGVVFPAVAATYLRDRIAAAGLLSRGLRLMLILVFPPVLLIVAFAQEGLTLWLGAELAAGSMQVLQWLAIGVFVNCVGQAPFAVMQAVGRPDITAKLHLAELPFYAVAIWWFTGTFGLAGVAIAWTLRVSIDSAALMFLAGRVLPEGAAALRRNGILLGVFAVGLVAILASSDAPLGSRMLGTAVVLTTFGFFSWRRLLEPHERAVALRQLRREPAAA
ncbi:MAG: flippase [Gemmatimonadaceae bacterium]|nr:flippase [Gemmatimonadaceae bacterium]